MGKLDAAILHRADCFSNHANAANLFAMLHELDRSDFEGIAVMPIPDHGLGLAINDRLRRAVQ